MKKSGIAKVATIQLILILAIQLVLPIQAFAADTEPPTVSISSPDSGESFTQGDSVSIYASATDNVGGNGMKIYIDGNSVKTSYSDSISYSTGSLSVGTHTIMVNAVDAANKSASQSVSITVQEKIDIPQVTSITINNGQKVILGQNNYQVPIRFTCKSDAAIKQVQFFVVKNGMDYLKETITPPIANFQPWDTTYTSPGVYQVKIVVTDKNNKQGQLAKTVEVINGTPLEANILINNGQRIVKGQNQDKIPIQVTVSSGITVKLVRYYVDNIEKYPSGSADLNYIWDISGTSVGTHTINVTVTDSNGIVKNVSKTAEVENAIATAVQGVNLDRSEVTLIAGHSTKLIPTVFPYSALNKSVWWSSNNPSVATVDTTGLVKALNIKGMLAYACITVRTIDGEKYDNCNITVIDTSRLRPIAQYSAPLAQTTQTVQTSGNKPNFEDCLDTLSKYGAVTELLDDDSKLKKAAQKINYADNAVKIFKADNKFKGIGEVGVDNTYGSILTVYSMVDEKNSEAMRNDLVEGVEAIPSFLRSCVDENYRNQINAEQQKSLAETEIGKGINNLNEQMRWLANYKY